MDCGGLQKAPGFLLAVFLGLVVAPATAQEQPPDRTIKTVWTTEDGLPQNSVTAILQTRDGYLWLGTFGGLVRFDGVRFAVFHTGNTPGLASNRILSLYEDRAGTLWIGTEDGGLSRFRHNQFTTYTTRDGLPDNEVFSVCEDRKETLWIGTGKGLAQFKESKVSPYDIKENPFGNGVYTLYASQDGSVWVGGINELGRFNDGRWTFQTPSDGLPKGRIWAMREDHHGSLWLGAWGEGLAQSRDGKWIQYTMKDGLLRNTVMSIYEDRLGNVWVGTGGGLNRFVEGKITTYTTQEGLSHNSVRSITEDREGNLWIGTDGGGLNRWKRAMVTAYRAASDVHTSSVVPIYEDREGTIWVGNVGEGLRRFKDGVLIPQDFPKVISNSVWSVAGDREGGLWIGTAGGGLLRLKDQAWSRYMRQHGLSDNGVFSIYEDRAGTLWVGTQNGLNRFTGEQFTVYRTTDGLVHNNVRFITEDRQGALWLGTRGGISRFKDGQFTNYTTRDGLSNDQVRAIHEDADGSFWIGTYGGGLNRFKDGKFAHITTENGLVDDVVSRILEDDRGHLWVSGNRGIFRVSRQELNDVADGKIRSISCVSYGVADGMKSSECNGGGQPAGWKTRDGRLWFPTIQGPVVIDPTETNTLPPPVTIERVVINSATIDPQGKARLPPGGGDLEIQYAGLSFIAPEKVRFKYKLEGYNDSWVEAGTRRVAYYTHLSPGDYRFRVIACNNEGVWNETGAAFEFYLKPHFHQTTWFYALSVAAVMLMSWGGYQWRVRHLKRRTQELAAKVAERTTELAHANEQLEDANVRLVGANDDMLSIFNRWRSGIMTTNETGAVTFLSRTGERLFGLSQIEVLGHPWPHVIPLSEADKTHLTAMAERPPVERSKLSVYVHGPASHRYWMEIEIQDDPRDPRRKMFFLYDVSEVYDLRRLLDEKAKFHDLVGESAVMQLVYRQAQDLARSETSVLIEGETGTGKELVARAIHYGSPRKHKPFIAVNCGGLTESLLGSQLFGHKKGAFTGATADQAGYFEAASGGTVFLDEIGDMPLSMQTSLLRVLQEKEFTRLGETSPRKVDVRVIAATNHDLHRAVAEGRFRQDLLYRIRGTRVHLPALRERREDIPLLAAWFLGQLRTTLDTPAQEISQDAMQALVRYDWPGNVRELKSAVESAAIQCRGPVIQVEDWPPEVLGFPLGPSSSAELRPASPAASKSRTPGRPARGDPRLQKKQQVQDALERAGGNRATAAELLGISRSTLYLWMKELGLEESPEEPGH